MSKTCDHLRHLIWTFFHISYFLTSLASLNSCKRIKEKSKLNLFFPNSFFYFNACGMEDWRKID